MLDRALSAAESTAPSLRRPRSPAAATIDVVMSLMLSPAACMFIERTDDDDDREDQPEPRPEGAELVVDEELEHGEDDEQDRESAVVTIAGVRPISIFMLARRSPSQTTIAIARRPASTPHPCHMLTPAEAMPANSTSCQLKIETTRKAMRGAEHELRAVGQLGDVHFANFSFPRRATGPSQLSLRYETDTTGSA